MTGARSASSVKKSYYTQRTLIGLAGFSLPTAVWLGSWALDGEALLGSISTYYYSSMRDVFVAILIGGSRRCGSSPSWRILHAPSYSES